MGLLFWFAFHKAKLRADFLRPVKAEDLVDDRDDFSPGDQQRIARAQRLLRVASDSAAAQHERQSAYDLAGKELDGVIVLPAATQASIERGISGQLER